MCFKPKSQKKNVPANNCHPKVSPLYQLCIPFIYLSIYLKLDRALTCTPHAASISCIYVLYLHRERAAVSCLNRLMTFTCIFTRLCTCAESTLPISRVYKRREREYLTPYYCVLTPFYIILSPVYIMHRVGTVDRRGYGTKRHYL